MVDAGRLLLIDKSRMAVEGGLRASLIERDHRKATATWLQAGTRACHFIVLADGRFVGNLSANVKKTTSVVDRTTMDMFFGKIMAARLSAVFDFQALKR